VDHQFSLLYLAKKFFIPAANFLSLDGNYLLPFPSAHFSSIISSDTLHLIDSKLNLSREFQRVISGKGTIILPHLHNRLSPIQFAKSLTPEGYGALFEGSQKRIIPEDQIVDRYIRSDLLDLERQSTNQELDNAIKGLSIIVSKEPSIFCRYDGLWNKYIERMKNAVVNPLYRITGSAGKWVLQKDPDASGKLSLHSDACLPQTASLSLPSLDQKSLLELRASDPSIFRDLASKFVLIDVPETFL